MVVLWFGSWLIGQVPFSHWTRVEPTVRGLTDLFDRECIKQSSANWALRQWRYDQRWCFGDGTCEINIVNNARWTVHTTEGQVIVMRYHWGDEQKHIRSKPLGCSMAVARNLSPMLSVIASGATYGGRPYVPSTPGGRGDSAESATWRPEGVDASRPGGPSLTVLRRVSQGENANRHIGIPWDERDAEQLWELFYEPVGSD